MIENLYARVMDENSAAVVFNLDLQNPVEIADFVAAFAGLGAQFERFIREQRPDLDGTVKIYVKEVRKGSIEAVLIPIAQTMIPLMDNALIVKAFVETVAQKIAAFMPGGKKLHEPSKTELTEIINTIAAIANDDNGRGTISSVQYRKTKTSVDFSLQMTSSEARDALRQIDAQYKEIEAVTDFDHENKLLTFYQSNRKDNDKTGEKGIIEDISARPLAVVYASDLAKERIKSEMLSGDRNIFKLGFFVDVNVQTRNGKPVAYRIKAVRDVIDLPDD